MSAAEVTVYVEAYSDDNPVFASPWSPSNPVFSVNLGEQRNAGTELIIISAKDPLRDGASITQFEILADEDEVVRMDRGRLVLSRDLPYDSTSNKV